MILFGKADVRHTPLIKCYLTSVPPCTGLNLIKLLGTYLRT
jgi:hypothetical protein